MQTFLPYKDFASSAKVLDRARLGKQRVETMQIMKALVLGVGWINHPATKMWRGYEKALLEYQTAICNEWTSRGYKDSCLEKTANLLHGSLLNREPFQLPPWLGLKKFHSAHRANLLRKDPKHYGRFKWKEEPAEGYYYPPEKAQ